MKTEKKHLSKIILAMFYLLIIGYSQYGYAGIEEYIREHPLTKEKYVYIEKLNPAVLQDVVLFLHERDRYRFIHTFVLADYLLDDESIFREFVEAMGINTTIRSLELYVGSMRKYMRWLENFMEKNTAIIELTLNRCGIVDEDAFYVARILEKNTILTELNLSQNYIGDAGLIGIAQALKHNTTLRAINLSRNSFGRAGVQAIAQMILVNSTLRILNMDWCKNMDELSYITLLQALENQRGLVTVYLNHNMLTANVVGQLARVLAINTNLTTIELRYNNIDDLGAQTIAQGLEHNTALTTIDLAYNHINNLGAVALANMLTRNTTLTTIDLGRNEIGDEGARALVLAFARNTTLQRINLNFNNINDVRINQLIGLILTRNESLKTLTEYLSDIFVGMPDLNADHIFRMIMAGTIYDHLNVTTVNEIQETVDEIRHLQENIQQLVMTIQIPEEPMRMAIHPVHIYEQGAINVGRHYVTFASL